MESQGVAPMEQEQKIAVELHVMTGFGEGAVAPTDKFDDEAVMAAATESQTEIQAPEIVCIDERHSNDSKEPVRRKTAAGALGSAYAGALLADWSLFAQFKEDDSFTKTPTEIMEYTADVLIENDVKLGAHIDNHATEENPMCGAATGLPTAVHKIASFGEDFLGAVELFDAEDYDEEIARRVIENARQLDDSGFLKSYIAGDMARVTREKGGVVEVLNGDGDEERDPGNTRHGHWGEFIVRNMVAGTSNDRDGAKIDGFQSDRDAEYELAKIGRNDYEQKLIRHGIRFYNIAIAHGLTKDQRVIVIKE